MTVARFLVGLGLAGKVTIGATVAAAATVGGAGALNAIPNENASATAFAKINDMLPEIAREKAATQSEREAKGQSQAAEKPMPEAALPGLCNAFGSGSEAAQAKKANAMAFTRLANMADTAGKSVAEFCEDYPKPEADPEIEGSSEGSGRPEGKGKPEGVGAPIVPAAAAAKGARP
jgi:hypothetical protein